LPDGRIVLVIADVSGKGVPAALLVSSFHAFLGAYLEGTVALVDLAQRLNGAIYRASTDDRFITAFLGLLDPDTGKLQSISAGHNPVYIARKNGSMEELSAGGVALGMLDMQFPYMSDEVIIGKGDRLLLYTDGITGATNEGSAQYDNCHPLKEFVAENGNMSAKEFVNSLISNIKQFCGSAPQADDITALYIIRS
jgi:sigma-B regulation protein RsbU (phosphoserine phosphatase)